MGKRNNTNEKKTRVINDNENLKDNEKIVDRTSNKVTETPVEENELKDGQVNENTTESTEAQSNQQAYDDFVAIEEKIRARLEVELREKLEKEINDLKNENRQVKIAANQILSEMKFMESRQEKDMAKDRTKITINCMGKVLEIFNLLNKILEETKPSSHNETILQSLSMIKSDFVKHLSHLNIVPTNTKPIDDFNPEIHEVIQEVEPDKLENNNKISHVLDEGYYFNDKIIKTCMVAIMRTKNPK